MVRSNGFARKKFTKLGHILGNTYNISNSKLSGSEQMNLKFQWIHRIEKQLKKV